MRHAAASDHDLIVLVRSGDLEAFGELYARHSAAALRVARAVSGDSHGAEDLVSEAFERIHGAITRGAGPDEAFRAYLYTVIRRLHIEHATAATRLELTDDFTAYEAFATVDDGTKQSAEAALISAAFATLPPRHQAVLWYVDVEGQSTSEAAVHFGLSANATAALAGRARKALQDAYLQAHVSTTAVAADCLPLRGKLGPYRNGSLSTREAAKVATHLETCRDCPAVLAELSEVGPGLRIVLLPLVLGGAAAAAFGGFGASPSAAAASLVPASGAKRSARTAAAAVVGAALLVGLATAVAASVSPSGAGGSTASTADPVVDKSNGASASSSIGTTKTPATVAPIANKTPADERDLDAPNPQVPPIDPTDPPDPPASPVLALQFTDAGDLVQGGVGVVGLQVVNTGGLAESVVVEVLLPLEQ